MRQTSLESYKELVASKKLGEMQQLIYEGFKTFGIKTDRELSALLSFKDPNILRPRRNELMKLGLIEEKGKRKCQISGKKAIVWGQY